MYLGHHWWKKEVPRYLLDIALLLALLQGLTHDRSFLKNGDKRHRSPTLEQLPNWQHTRNNENNSKLQNLLLDYDVDNNSFHYKKGLNISLIAAHNMRNVAVNMVLVLSMNADENSTLDHAASPTISGFERDAFSFENMQALDGWNNSSDNLLVDTTEQSNTQTFDNAEDVRWQQYLNIDNNAAETLSTHCASSSCTENDISKSDSFTSIATISQQYSPFKDNPLDISNFLLESFNGSHKNIPTTSRDTTFSFNPSDHELRLNQSNSKVLT